jgi:RNA polymerase sigma-70 factor (ECF subfamily)
MLCRILMNLSDPSDFATAFDEHHRSVYAAAYRVVGDHALASDVVQDVFLRVWRRPQSFNPERADLGTYLRLIARSRAIDLIRESQARGRATDRIKVVVAEEEPRDVDARPDVVAARSSEREAVRNALGGLPPTQREALVLAYWGGLTAEQIARYAKIPLGTAKSRIRLGLAKLRADVDLGAVAV